MTRRLAALLEDVEVAEVVGGDPAAVDVTSVTQDSRAVGPGALYCCIVGRHVDGHDLAASVVGSGAGSLLVERVVDVAVTQVRVTSTREAVAPVAAAYWGHPSARLSVVGVTGTNGKTTTVDLIAAILARRRSTHRRGRHVDGCADDAGGAGAPGTAGRLPRRGLCSCRHGGLVDRPRPAPRRRRRVRRRGLDQPQPGPPRLPRRHGVLLPGEGRGSSRPGAAGWR